MVNSPFRIDILDSTGTSKTGDGPLTNIISISDTRALDKIGTLSFTVFANDPKTRYLTEGSQFDVYDEIDGYLGRFLFYKQNLSDTDGRATITIECWSILKELVYNIAGFAREYETFPVQSIIDDLVTDITGWSTSTDPNMGLANVTYQGHTIYQAVEELAKRWGYHFRLTNGYTRQLEFKSLGDLNSNVRLTNLQGQANDNVAEIGIIKNINETISTDEVYNRVIAVGAGTGAAMLTLLNGEVGDTYTVQSRTRTNGQTEYYIEDATSIATYGVREAVLIFDDIRPIANTATAKTNAKSELLKNAEIWLGRYKDARYQYDNLTVYGLKTDINVGDKVAVRYKGFDDNGDKYLDVDSTFWVLQHTRIRQSATGDRSSSLTVVNIDRAEQSDTDIMASAVKAIHSEKLWIKPTAFRFENTYYDQAQYFTGGTQVGKNATFNIDIDSTVTDITRVVVKWKTYPLWTATDFYQWGPATVSAGTVPAQATRSIWYLREGDLYPKAITMKINGTNVNNDSSIDYLSGGTGPWNNTTSDVSVEVEMDITDFIINAGIYNTFTITFELGTTGSEIISFPSSNNSTDTIPGGGSHGVIEFTVKCQGVAQSIYRD